MFLRLTLGCLLVSLTAQAVAAQDARIQTDWAGPYLGLSLGAGSSDGGAEREDFTGAVMSRDVAIALFPSAIDDREIGIVGGAALGYNVQRGGSVFGVELDVSALDQDLSHGFSRVDPALPDDPLFGAFAGGDTNTSYRTDFEALASLRLRAGLTRGRGLFYATGGLAAGDVSNRFGLALPDFGPGYSNQWSEDGIRFGFIVGAGIERRLSARASVKAEFLHFDLEDVEIHAEDPPVFNDNAIDYRFKNDGQILRLGINLRF